MKYHYQYRKYSGGSFLEEPQQDPKHEVICKNCNSVGHAEGFCGTYYKQIELKGFDTANKVEFYSSQNNWQQGFPMSKSKNYWSIKSKFLQGKVQFKFKINDKDWITSSEYNTCQTNEGYINNYMNIIPGREEDYIVLDSKKSLRKDNLIYIKFQINELSIKKMCENLNINYDKIDDIQIMIWGDWNQWQKGSIMKLQSKQKKNYKQWCCYLQLSPKKHYYKFQINHQWILDPYRESEILNNYQNHIFEAHLDKEDLLDEIETQPEQTKIQKSVSIKKFMKEEMQTVDLWGHSMTIVNGNIYIIGGVGRNSYTNTIYKMNLKTYHMEFIDMEDQNGPEQLAFHKVIKYQQKLIVYGGQNEYAVSNEYHTFNCITKKWTCFKFKKNIPKREHFTATRKNNTCRVYFFGGYFFHPDAKEDKMFNDLHMLNLKIMDFQKIETQNTPKERCHHSAIMFGWNLVVFGGCHIQNYQRQVFNDMHEINLSIEKQIYQWNKIDIKGPCPEPRYGHLAIKHKQLMIMQGGKTSMNGIKEFYLSDLWIYNNIQRSWTEINQQNYSIKKAFHAGCFYKGKLIVFGGKFSNKFSLQEANTFYEIDLFSQEQEEHKIVKQRSFSMFNQ